MDRGLLLAKLGRRVFRRFPSPRNQRFVQRTFRKWCTRAELETWTAEEFAMRVSPHDYISSRIFFFGNYDFLMTSFLKYHVREGGVCMDLGAERGWFSLLMAKLVGPNGRVDAFEPSPQSFARLQQNVSLNSWDWITLHNKAVSDRNGTLHFVAPSEDAQDEDTAIDDCSGAGYVRGDAAEGSVVVEALSLDEHVDRCPLTRLDFIKMDIEGAELAALRGARRTVTRFKPVLAVEYNRKTALRAGTSVPEIDDLLDSYGYERYLFWDHLQRFSMKEFEARSDAEAVIDVYCFPPG